MITINGFSLDMRENTRPLPVIVVGKKEGEYHLLAPMANNLYVFVEMLPYWALVARMDDENLHHPCEDNTCPRMVGGQFPNFFIAPEKGKGRVSLRSQRDHDLGMMFHSQGERRKMRLDFFRAVKAVRQKGKTWMGNPLKTDKQVWMEQRGSGLPAPSALRVPPFPKREISPVFEEGYFKPVREFGVVIDFLPLDEFNKLAKEKGMSEWDPYAEEA